MPRLTALRRQDERAADVRPVELFYDLVYVLAVTELTRHLLDHLTLRGAVETLIILLAVWGAWNQVAWVTNYFDLDARSARLVLIGLAFVSLVMSSSIVHAFGSHGLAFGAALSASLLGAQAWSFTGVGLRHPLTLVFARVGIWWLPVSALMIAGGLAHGDTRIALWAAAIAVLYVATGTGFPVPGLGRSRTTDYTITGAHMAERALLFVTIALGESILVIGSRFGDLPRTAGIVTAFAVAFVGSAAFWWIYFDSAAEAAMQMIEGSQDPGRLGVLAYTFFHVPIVAGIIVAAGGYELALAHPSDDVNTATACLLLGGPALFIAGHTLFKWSVWNVLPAARIAALVVLAALIPVAAASTRLVLLAAATGVVVLTAVASSLPVSTSTRTPAPSGRTRSRPL
jgi:low temperature requirement protein LtrA